MYIQRREGLGRLPTSYIYDSRREGLGRLPTSYIYDSSTNGIGLLDNVTPSGPITVAKLASSLTNLVFFARHPDLEGRPLKPKTKEAAEWSQILKTEIRSALHHSFDSTTNLPAAQWKISQLIFFSRHPDILGHFKDQPKDEQQKLQKEFDDISKNIVQPLLQLQIARGKVNSRTIFVVDNNDFRRLPWETRNRAGEEIASQFAFVNGNAPMTVMFLDPGRFPEEFNFSDAVVGVTGPGVPPSVHVSQAERQQRPNLERAIAALGSRQRVPPPKDRVTTVTDRAGQALINKFVTARANGRQVAVPLMTSAINMDELIDQLNKERIPIGTDEIPTDKSSGQPAFGWQKLVHKWTAQQKELVGIALGRVMAHEVRHLYVGAGHANDGLGRDKASLFDKDATFSAADRTRIRTSITRLERQQGTRAVAPSFAASARSFDFPF
jgi:hypothetical protein